MTFLQLLAQRPLFTIAFILVGVYIVFWVFISVAITVSPKARDYFSSFLPQWWGRKGRPFTTHEKIGACFQVIALIIILLLIFKW